MKNTITLKGNKAQKLVKGLKSKIEEVKNEFFTIRHLTSLHELSAIEIEKKYNALLRIEDIEINENGHNAIVKSVKILSKGKKNRILYEVRYGSHGLIIMIGDNAHKIGIYSVRFSDFACENLTQIIFTKKCLDRLEHYKIDIVDGLANGTCTVYDRKDKSFLGKLVAYLKGSKNK